MKADTANRRYDKLPVVFVQRVRCPRCGSDDHQTLRSIADQGDGSSLRRARCRSCGQRFSIVVDD